MSDFRCGCQSAQTPRSVNVQNLYNSHIQGSFSINYTVAVVVTSSLLHFHMCNNLCILFICALCIAYKDWKLYFRFFYQQPATSVIFCGLIYLFCLFPSVSICNVCYRMTIKNDSKSEFHKTKWEKMFWTHAQAQTQSKYLNNLSQKWSISPILSFVAAAFLCALGCNYCNYRL